MRLIVAVLSMLLALPVLADQTNSLRPTQDACSWSPFACPNPTVCYGADTTCTDTQGGNCQCMGIAAAPDGTYGATCYAYFHGGGGTGGIMFDNDNWHFIQDVADLEDITSFTIDYTYMDPDTVTNACPVQMDDAINALNHMYTNYGCRYIMTGGHSWGGLIATNLLWNTRPAACGGSATLNSNIVMLGGFATSPVLRRADMTPTGTVPCATCANDQAGCIVDRWLNTCAAGPGTYAGGNPYTILTGASKPLWTTTCSNDNVATAAASAACAAAQPAVVTHQALAQGSHPNCSHNGTHSCAGGDWVKTQDPCDETWNQTQTAVTALIALIPADSIVGDFGWTCNGCSR